ncbi:hypothetical protein [Amycolatopsis sp. cmx-4-54]|uniref:hypothetical protein n=1 Tax=Amycolatopsis sp. cmx-4-54 TaxID=2790936 RepID=UPI00397A63F8
MSPNWSPLLIIAAFAAMGWGHTRPGLARAGRCVATMLLAWWVAMIQTRVLTRVLRGLSTNLGAAQVAGVGLIAPGVVLTVVLGPPHAQGVE